MEESIVTDSGDAETRANAQSICDTTTPTASQAPIASESYALFIDLETSGLPFNNSDPYNTSMYDNARVLQVAAMLCDSALEPIEMMSPIVRVSFAITNHDIHGITNAVSRRKGIAFTVVASDFHKLLVKATHIYAHNAMFDVNVMKSELYRNGLQSIIDEMNTKTVVCTMHGTRDIVRAKTARGRLKVPKLAELYRFATDKELEHAHDAKYDVLNLHEAMRCLCTRGLWIVDERASDRRAMTSTDERSERTSEDATEHCASVSAHHPSAPSSHGS